MPHNDEQYEKLLTKVNNIEKELRKQRSWKRLIPRAIFNGVFASFGATIVFAIIIFILAQLIKSANQIPIINDIIERTKLEQLVTNYNDIEVNGTQDESNDPPLQD